jgi:F0F1-type ATP synthase membrane subunit b/b'
MISIDFTLFLVFFAFLIFVQLFKAAFFDKISALRAQRLLAIKQAEEEADSAIVRYLELEATYETTLQEANAQAKLIVAQSQQAAKKQHELTILTTRQALEADLSAHIASLQADKEALLAALLLEKPQFLPLLEEKLLPATAYLRQGASIV